MSFNMFLEMEINFHIEIIFFSINWWMVTVNALQGGAQVMYRS
jgi:hypothetical protein